MSTQTILSFAITMSDSGYGDYVIINLAKANPDVLVPTRLPHKIGSMVGGEKTAIEFESGEEDARKAYDKIVKACLSKTGILRGTITLVGDGTVETTVIE